MHRRFFAILVLVLGCTAVQAAGAPQPPKVDAKAHFLIDMHSERVLSADGADERLEAASLTKMMTSYVVFSELVRGKFTLSDQVLVSEKAWRMQGSRMFIEVGTRVPVEALLMGLIVQSGNDAAVALAEFVAGDERTFARSDESPCSPAWNVREPFHELFGAPRAGPLHDGSGHGSCRRRPHP